MEAYREGGAETVIGGNGRKLWACGWTSAAKAGGDKTVIAALKALRHPKPL